MATFAKDPVAILDYILDWSDWLDSDVIVNSLWTAEPGITIVTDSRLFTDTTTTVWLSDGALRSSYKVSNTITTDGGRVQKHSFHIRIESA